MIQSILIGNYKSNYQTSYNRNIIMERQLRNIKGQCFDLANFYWNYITGGGRLAGYYAKDIPFKNNFNGLATVYENTPNFLPQKGDIVVWNGNYGGGAGHVAIVWSANLNSFVSLDQNWWGGGASKTEVAQFITHSYDFPMYFIRPHYKKETIIDKVKPKPVAKPSAKKPAKGKKIVLVAGHGLVLQLM